MRVRTPKATASLLLLGSCWLGACGPELSLETRLSLTPDQLSQNYEIKIFATSSGASNYLITANFMPTLASDEKNLPLPAGDTFTVNGTALTYSEVDSSYSASGTGNPGLFTFSWTHEGTSYTNAVTAALYPPLAVPSSVSKSTGVNIQVPNAPSGVVISGTVNAGTNIQAPFVEIPITVSGGGTSSQSIADFSALNAGPGVLTLIEAYSGPLQAPTAGGGNWSITVQYGYNVTIGP